MLCNKRINMITKTKRVYEWAIAFWIGVGLMSIINVWKIIQGRNPILYSWIMFGISILAVVICILLIRNKRKK